MIETLVGPLLRHAESFDDDRSDDLFDGLFDEERAVVANAVPKRQREFATVRRCARAALAELGVAPRPILPGERGAPGWPDGVVGSMTHCAGYRAAVVARSSELGSVGIDAEPNEPLPGGVLDAVSLPQERVVLAALPRCATAWDRLLFSAKESVYKAWFPLTNKFLEFEQAAVTLDPNGTFSARLLVPGPTLDGEVVGVFAGRWVVSAGLLATAVMVPRRNRV